VYIDHWHLNDRPFDQTPDPKYIYYSREHEEALMRLIYTVRDLKGAMLLTGLYGCGKTVLSRVFLNELVGSKYEIALIANPRLNPDELILEMVYQLGGGLHEGKSKGELLRIFNQLIYSNLNQGKETIVVIDEAQTIEDLETFEELRLLLNFQQNDRYLLTLILIGQSELRNRLAQLPQLKQRLLIDYHLNPLDENDTAAYIDHRLNVAGAQDRVFDESCKRLIYKLSGGIPRVINGICDMALFEEFSRGGHIMTEDSIRKVAKQTQSEAIWKIKT
jgi:general secretion pathway protein A